MIIVLLWMLITEKIYISKGPTDGLDNTIITGEAE